ncbi:radical SAM protein [Streptomyces sp. NPDC086783]|uniref:radical SAM protein n=1 Tax=Streptomyces sp. NPDC086783 TaxID=3365758 RepID=UPI003813FC18
MTALLDSSVTTAPAAPDVLELEITNRCQLTCSTLCFVQAGPTKGHGTMEVEEWRQVISQAAALGLKKIKLIGGEPSLHPHFGELLEHALAEGQKVIVFSGERTGAVWCTHADADGR